MRFATKPIRVAQYPEREHNAVTYPLYQTTTFLWHQMEEEPSTAYSRVSNPNRSVLEQVLASIENAEFCTAYSSGMAAVAGSLASLRQGDHLVMASDIYGGTHRLVEVELPKAGIHHSVFDAMNPNSLAHAVNDQTKLVIFEGPTNPLLNFPDIPAIVSEAKRLGLITVFDNTFASPALINPLDLGVDIVVHSTTKYITGHSDVIGGALMTNREDLATAALDYLKNVGACPSPFDCWLCLRGLKTLDVRMERHCKNAQRIAEWLEQDSRVTQVNYPGLASSPSHNIASRLLKGYGGMISFEVESPEVAKHIGLNTKIFMLAESLGGVESLIGYPKLMSHSGMSEPQRLERGIGPSLLRLSVGIEDAEDLIEDLDNAFSVGFRSRVTQAKVDALL